MSSDRIRHNRPARPQRLLLVCLVFLLVAVGCDSPEPPACPDEIYPAVELEVVDESDEPLMGAGLRFRVDQGEWQEWPENLGRRTIIRGAPGLYQLEVARPGFESAATTLEVPVVAEDVCRPLVQTVTLQLARMVCPEPPAALTLMVDPPVDELQATLNLPESGRQRLACQDADGDFCRRFSFDVVELGTYDVALQELPGLGAMQVISNVVAYDMAPVTLLLEHRGLTATAEISGVETVDLHFPVRRDEANCPLADLQDLETTYPSDQSGGEAGRRPPLALHYQGGLLMTDLGAEACRTEPVLTALPFSADLPAGTDLADVQVQVEYGNGWQTADCEFRDGRYLCQALVPNPLLNQSFVARIAAGDQVATGLSLPFSGLCLVFQ